MLAIVQRAELPRGGLAVQRGRWAMVVALVPHLAALVLIREIRSSERVPKSGPLRDVTELIDVTRSDDVAVPTLPVAPPVREPRSARAADRGAAPPARARDGSDPSAATAVVEAPAGSWTFSPTGVRAPIDLSMGAARYRVPAAEDRGAAASDDTRAGVFTTLDDRDVDMGLGRGGPVVIAVEEAVRTSESGVMGVALFDVSLDQGGHVVVDVAHADGAAAPWEQLRSSVERMVATKAVRVPENARGLRVRVRVEAREKLADGRDVRTLGNSASASLGQAGTESVAMKEMPNVGLEHRGKVCSGRLSIGVHGGDLAAGTNFGGAPGGGLGGLTSLLTPLQLAGGCSVENIGTPARRIVAAREVGEHVF